MRSALVITARLGSSRLPRKMLADVGGATAFELLVRRLRRARRPDLLLLATTTEIEDDELVAAAEALGVTVFRGPTSDILERWRQAAVANRIDLLVTCDGDDLFCDPDYADRIVDTHQHTGAEYITCVELPFGAAPTGVALTGLERVCARKRDTDTEGQGRFFAADGIVSRAQVVADAAVRHAECRMTLDYPQDLEFFTAVLAELAPDPAPPLEAIVDLLRRRPDLVAINAGLQKEYWARFNARYKPVEMDP